MKEEDLSTVQKKPLTLPEGFEWVTMDIQRDEDAQQVYDLLLNNYVEDSDNQFRFAYPIDFIRWTLLVPEYKQSWHLGVKATKSGKLLGFISGTPVSVTVDDEETKMAEINFLCVHKKLRSKKLAPVLIREITRRANLKKVWKAVFTAGVVFPTPFTSTTYYHRNLQPKKLVNVGFSQRPPNFTMARYCKKYDLDQDIELELQGTVRKMEPKDAKRAYEMLMEYLKTFKYYQNFTFAEFKHLILPRENTMHSYVIVSRENPNEVLDFFSFYQLPTQALQHQELINIMYMYYYAPKVNSVKVIIAMALKMAKEMGADVFNALDIMQNPETFEDLKFGRGDGLLHYYFYNYRADHLTEKDVGMILV